MSASLSNNNENKNSHLLPKNVKLWLIAIDILIGLNFSYVMFSTPIYLHFQSLLSDCAIQGSLQGCHAANSNEDTSCTWFSSNTSSSSSSASCYFTDGFDCSPYSNDSVKCSTDPIVSHYCFYRYVSSSSSNTNTTKTSGGDAGGGQCLHRAGWNEVKIGLFAAFSIFGGIFGPFTMQKLANYKGFPFTIIVCGIIAVISAIIFSVAIEAGQNFAMFLLSKILASICSYAGAYLYPAILSTCKFLHVDLEEKTFHTRVMGSAISFAAVLESIYLYFDTPSLQERPSSSSSSSSFYGYTTYYPDFVDFKLRLQLYNIVQYLIGIGFVLFGVKLYSMMTIVTSDGDDDTRQEQQPEENKREDGTEMSTKQHQQRNEPTVTTAISSLTPSDEQEEKPTSSPSSLIINTQQNNDDDDEQQSLKDKVLMFSGGLLMPIVLQLSGQTAINSFVPIIMADVTPDPLLAQIIATIPMPIGAIFSFVVLQKYFTPLQIFLVCAIITSVSCFLMGFGVSGWLNENNNIDSDVVNGGREETSSASIGLTLAGLVLFSLSFFAGAGTLIFAVMIEIYNSRGTWPQQEQQEEKKEDEKNENEDENNQTEPTLSFDEQLQSSETRNENENNEQPVPKKESASSSSSLLNVGVAVTGSWTGLIQFCFRMAFPVFVRNIYPSDVRVGRAIAFFGFGGFALIMNTALFVTQRARGKRERLAPKGVVDMTDRCGDCCCSD